MGILELRVTGLVFHFCALACFLVIQGSAVNPAGGLPGILPNVNVSITISPSSAPQPNGTVVQPPLIMPPLISPISSPLPTAPSIPTSFLPTPPPSNTHDSVPAVPPMPPPEPIASPPNKRDMNSSAPASTPPNPDLTKPPISNPPLTPIAPVASVPAIPRIPDSPGPVHSVLPNEPPSLSPERHVSIPPAISRNVSPPVKSPLPEEPQPSPPDPPASKSLGHFNKAPAPHPVSKSPPVSDSPKEHNHAPDYIISPAPSLNIIPPPSSKPAPQYHKISDPKSNLSHYAPPPTSTGSSKHV